jgi:nitrate/TMAO reductase-like tetraheme cytochrome c subunit
MKKAMLLVLFILALTAFMMGQNWSSSVDVLGAHNNQGRGCAGCHAPHSGAYGSGHTVKYGTDTGSYALWGQDASPLYGQTIAFGDNGRYVEVLPGTITGGGTDVGGILLCLSCHDGNLTPHNMMANQSYEQAIGLLTNTTYGSNPIPTLLGNDGTYAGNYTNDHPVGQNATISSGSGLVWANNTFTVTAGTPYALFVNNYGWPALAPGKYSNPYGVNGAGKPYVVCTTCHNQHVMTVYTSSSASQIQGDGGGKFYATYFFINGPYNPNLQTYNQNQAPSTTEFCRQCHFGESNEANNTNSIKAQFQ